MNKLLSSLRDEDLLSQLETVRDHVAKCIELGEKPELYKAEHPNNEPSSAN